MNISAHRAHEDAGRHSNRFFFSCNESRQWPWECSERRTAHHCSWGRHEDTPWALQWRSQVGAAPCEWTMKPSHTRAHRAKLNDDPNASMEILPNLLSGAVNPRPLPCGKLDILLVSPPFRVLQRSPHAQSFPSLWGCKVISPEAGGCLWTQTAAGQGGFRHPLLTANRWNLHSLSLVWADDDYFKLS